MSYPSSKPRPGVVPLPSKLIWSAVATASLVNAHFMIDFPAVRGPFFEDNEPQFCGWCFLGGRR